MPPKRYSIYASAALDKALAERLRPDDLGDGYPSRSGIITAMCDLGVSYPELSCGILAEVSAC